MDHPIRRTLVRSAAGMNQALTSAHPNMVPEKMNYNSNPYLHTLINLYYYMES